MLIREKKKFTWEEDIAFAKEIHKELNPVVDQPEEFFKIIRKYCAEKTEITHSPKETYRDGYGNKEIWLQSEVAIRNVEEEFIKDQKLIKFYNCYTTGVGIILRETLMYIADDDLMVEAKRFTCFHVNDKQIIGSLTYSEDEPKYALEAKEKAGKDAVNKLSDKELDLSTKWPKDDDQTRESWLWDCECAKYYSKNMMALYTECDETKIFMHRIVDETIFTRQYPPFPTRDGVGDRDYWLNCEYATRVASKINTPKKKNLKHVDIFSIGNIILFDEDRVYRVDGDKIYYLRNTIAMPVYNQKVIGFECFLEPYPNNVLPEKLEIFKKAQATIKSPPLDYSMLKYMD